MLFLHSLFQVPAAGRCCYKAAGLKPCASDRIAVRNLTIGGEPCVVQNDVSLRQCRGGCPSLQKMEFAVNKVSRVGLGRQRFAWYSWNRALRFAQLCESTK